MNAERQADGLLSAGQTIALLEIISQAVDGVTAEQAARDLSARRAASHSRTRNSLAMLVAADLLIRQDDRFSSLDRGGGDWRSRIAQWAARQTAERMARDGAHALQLHDDNLVIDPMQLPGPVDGLRLWLIEFGVTSRAGSSSRRWVVAQAYRTLFLGAARAWNDRRRSRLSQAALEERLDQQAIDGAITEEWVLERERARLSTHPLLKQVARISLEDAGAGYDIISFSTAATLVHDHFLEVKSFRGRRRFFWTRNEIEAARRLGEGYHLCIIDRDRMNDTSYRPEVISGPYAALIETQDNGWSISPVTFECIAIDR